MDYDFVSNHLFSDATIYVWSLVSSLKLARAIIHVLRNSTKLNTFLLFSIHKKQGAFDIICMDEPCVTDDDKEMCEKEYRGSFSQIPVYPGAAGDGSFWLEKRPDFNNTCHAK